MEYKKLIIQEIFNAKPARVYSFFTDEKKLSSIIDAEVVLPNCVGEDFVLFGGAVDGVIKELIVDQRIVWSWRCVVAGWPDEHVSEVVIELSSHQDDQTLLKIIHEKVPSSAFTLVKDGWMEYFLKPLAIRLNGEVLRRAK